MPIGKLWESQHRTVVQKDPVACDGHELKRLGMITVDMEFNEKHMFWNRNYIGYVRN